MLTKVFGKLGLILLADSCIKLVLYPIKPMSSCISYVYSTYVCICNVIFIVKVVMQCYYTYLQTLIRAMFYLRSMVR